MLLQGSEAAAQQGALPLQPDYLLLDGVGRRHVIPARLAVASGQDWWVPRSRVDLCVLTDALNFAAQSQLWLLSNSPRPSVRCSPNPGTVWPAACAVLWALGAHVPYIPIFQRDPGPDM